MSEQEDYYDKIVKGLPPRLPRGSPENYQRVVVVGERMRFNPPRRADYLARLKRERDAKQKRLSWLNKTIERVEQQLKEDKP